MSLMYLFPTTIYQEFATVNNYDPVQIEIQSCLKEIHETENYCNVSYIFKDAKNIPEEKTLEQGYFIKDQLIKNYNLENLEKRIYMALENYLSAVQWSATKNDVDPIIPKKKPGEFKIVNSWINIGVKGTRHEYHCHPGYTISGVYYFRVSDLQGGICFNNPNLMLYHAEFPEGRTSPTSIEYIPKDGEIILFPGWLQHSTVDNKSDEERISVAFNINYISNET